MSLSIEQISREIEKMRESALCLENYSNDIPALKSNLQRLKASITMLELNFVEPLNYIKNPDN